MYYVIFFLDVWLLWCLPVLYLLLFLFVDCLEYQIISKVGVFIPSPGFAEGVLGRFGITQVRLVACFWWTPEAWVRNKMMLTTWSEEQNLICVLRTAEALTFLFDPRQGVWRLSDTRIPSVTVRVEARLGMSPQRNRTSYEPQELWINSFISITFIRIYTLVCVGCSVMSDSLQPHGL